METISSNKILIVGSVPPPVGGVTVFLKYFSEALTQKNIAHRFFSFKKVFCLDYSLVHINASNPLKRFLLILFYKSLARKVYFVKHGGLLDTKNAFVKFSLFLADGVFCLNPQVRQQLEGIGVRCLIHSTLFLENISAIRSLYPRRVDSGSKVLFYINNSGFLDGNEIYGASFFSQALSNLSAEIQFTIVDLSGDYRVIFEAFENVTYIDSAVDFCALLSQHDLYVRCTSTDGMSVALLEAGLLGVKCLASDVVARQEHVTTYIYNDMEDFLLKFGRVLSKPANGVLSEFSSVDSVVEFMFHRL